MILNFLVTKLSFYVTNSFNKLSRSLCEPKSPYTLLITTIQLLKKFEIKLKLHKLRYKLKLGIDY